MAAEHRPVHDAGAAPAGVFRRLAALAYDGLLIAALLMAVSVPPVLLNDGPIRDSGAYAGLKNIAYFGYLLAWVFLFYGWCWTHGGQTVGMAAWRLRVVGDDGLPVGWRQALVRFTTSLLGLGNLWAGLDPDKRGWHEHLSHSHTLLLPKKRRR